MGSISSYCEKKWLDHALKVAVFTTPGDVYLALSTTDPDDSEGNITEPVGNGYAREAITFGTPAASRTIANTVAIAFDQASGNWGTLTHWGIFDSLTNGEMLAHGSLDNEKTIVSGNTATVAIGEVTITVNSGAVGTYLANEMLDHTFANATFTPPTNIFAGLSIGNPGDTGSGVSEPPDEDSIGSSASAYERCTVNTWNAAVDGSDDYSYSTNDGQFGWSSDSFAEGEAPGSNWSLVGYVFLTDVDWATSPLNHILFYTAIDTPQIPGVGDTVKFADGALKLRLR